MNSGVFGDDAALIMMMARQDTRLEAVAQTDERYQVNGGAGMICGTG